jgi:hypothetical protein
MTPPFGDDVKSPKKTPAGSREFGSSKLQAVLHPGKP